MVGLSVTYVPVRSLFYTLIDSCKRNDLDPETYLAEGIERLPEHATAEQAAELTPAKIAAARRLTEDDVAALHMGLA